MSELPIDEVDDAALHVRIAIEAMKALIGKIEYRDPSYMIDEDGIASDAWAIADAMMAKRNINRGGYAAVDQE